jgi:hypothetical protein
MGVICSTHESDGKAYRIVVGKSEGKGPFGRPKCRWEDNSVLKYILK